MSKRERFARWLILAGLLLLLAALAFKVGRIYRAANSLLARQNEAEALLAGGLSNLDANAVEALVTGIREDVVTIRRETAVFLPLTPLFSGLPRVGPLATNAAPLLEMADAGTETAAYALRGLKPALPILQDPARDGTEKLAALVDVLQNAAPDLRAAEAALARYTAARASLGDPTHLPWRAQTLLQRADAYHPLAQDGLRLAQIMPAFMGNEETRRYLLLAQNEEELRPTGGFIAGAGELVLVDGRIQTLTFADANYADDYANKPYPFPPQPLYDFMGLELFLLRDANFWPDFPTSARMAMELYQYGQDAPPLDGVIAFDQQFMRLLVTAIGEVPIPEESVTINQNNVIAAMREAWSYEEGQDVGQWVRDRKAFLGTFANGILRKVQTDFGRIDPLALAQAMHAAAQLRHLQIYVTDPTQAAVFDALNWDGRYANETGQDVLGVVDTNVGYNKVNSLIVRAIRYQVDLGSRQAQLELTYQHNGTPEPQPCYQGTPYAGGISYEARINTCYWNYLRIYAPQGTQLLAATLHEIPGETMFSGQEWRAPAQLITEPVPLAVVANAFLLPWGETLTSNYSFQLPATIVQAADGQQIYRLTVYKQAGTGAQPLEVVVQLPEGAALATAVPQPALIEGNSVTFRLTPETNVQVQVIYQEKD